jgi:hypothetical protein
MSASFLSRSPVRRETEEKEGGHLLTSVLAHLEINHCDLSQVLVWNLGDSRTVSIRVKVPEGEGSRSGEGRKEGRKGVNSERIDTAGRGGMGTDVMPWRVDKRDGSARK